MKKYIILLVLVSNNVKLFANDTISIRNELFGIDNNSKVIIVNQDINSINTDCSPIIHPGSASCRAERSEVETSDFNLAPLNTGFCRCPIFTPSNKNSVKTFGFTLFFNLISP
jgi:hypothetical protein